MQRQLAALILLGILLVEGTLAFEQDDKSCLPPNRFKCKNSDRCIPHFFVCDKQNDCTDGSDEEHCGTKPNPFVEKCKPTEFQCADKAHCIDLEDFCDSKPDCLDGSDEYPDCHLIKTCHEFKCVSGQCISKKWVCDGMNDCMDGSDEQNCDSAPIEPNNCNNTIGKYLCANKRCISLTSVCDGVNNCGDDSDENPAQCAKATIACGNSTLHCQQKCSATPAGPVCSCEAGYILKNNTKCEDVDECLGFGVCDQACRNTPGSYYCQCESGYSKQEDGKSCKADTGEALMIFASKTSIRAFYLDSQIYFSIADDLQHVVGVSLDSHYVYWSDIQLGDEAIFRSLEDGSKREVIVTAGLGCPEDIAVDWVTGNIYFTDSLYKHVGVCSKDGVYCTVIIKEDTEKPRGIALLPSDGRVYWSDWGDNPHISFADMDGSNRDFLIQEKIGWPNGLTIDYPSRRLYWVDAKLKVIESILLDGRDRRIVLHDFAKHPYSIAIFENKLFWTDWSTNSIHSCNKFTGKDFSTLFQKNETLYGIHIYHSTLKVKYANPCLTNPCSQLCLLGANRTYTCACTLDKELSDDKHTCKDSAKRKHIAIAAGSTMIDYYHELLGRPRMRASITSDPISAMTYDSLTDSIIAINEINQSIFRYNPHSGTVSHVALKMNGVIGSLAFDRLGNNIYLSNTFHKKIEVYSLTTGQKTEFSYTQKPYNLALVPEEGMMFVVFNANDEFHIDKVQMNGLGSRTHVVEHGLVGPQISLTYDPDSRRIYWADEGAGRIESMNTQGQSRQFFRTGITAPISIAVLESEVFWTSRNVRRLNWANKKITVPGIKGLNLRVADELEILYLQTISGLDNEQTHPCHANNGDCSHICLVTNSTSRLCGCPAGMLINSDMKTCKEKTMCAADEFRCELSKLCITKIERCNGVSDCPYDEDEQDCPTEESSCQHNEFACHSGECIEKARHCDSVYDCADHSDEEHCEYHACTPDEYRCRSGACISKYLVCNGMKDCEQNEDEEDCAGHACDDHSFKCSNGLCIPQNWECDGQIDCTDGTDEHESCKPSACGASMFSCKNGRCIDELLKCNGLDDCEDNSDEDSEECPQNKTYEALICTRGHYKCRNSSTCIPESWKCNGHEDCPEVDDELGCGRCLPETQFACTNGKCIPVEWACDNMDDCGDGSDEKSCTKPSQPTSTRCPSGHFACSTGFCLDLDKVCDGRPNCIDGSDEGGDCDKACETNNTCENVCHKTPAGPVCSCRTGYELEADEKSCRDVDECQENVCPQICTNQPGSFTCSCYEGYALRLDRVSCKATGPSMRIITATQDDIRILSPSLTQKSVAVVAQFPGVEITGLDVNARENTIFWSNENLGTINKVQVDTKKITTASDGIGRPEVLALDWITNNVYFFDNQRAPMIKACNVDANKSSIIVHIKGPKKLVSAIAVEPVKEILFWGEVTWKVLFEKPVSEIKRTDLMGNNETVLLSENLGLISGLTIDHHRSLLYWADHFLMTIGCVDFDGKNRKSILSDLVSKPIGLNFFEDSLYWQAETSGILRKHQLYGSMVYNLLVINSKNLNRLFGLSQVSRQPYQPDKCASRGCEHMCVIYKGQPTCICSNGFPTMDNSTECSEDTAIVSDYELELEARTNEARFRLNGRSASPELQEQTSQGERRTGAFFALALTLVGCALLYSVYYYVNKKRPGFFKSRDLSIHFRNPAFPGRRNNNNSSSSNNNASTTSGSSILMPGEHEYANPISEMSNVKLTKSNSMNKRLELQTEMDVEPEDPSSNYSSRLIR